MFEALVGGLTGLDRLAWLNVNSTTGSPHDIHLQHKTRKWRLVFMGSLRQKAVMLIFSFASLNNIGATCFPARCHSTGTFFPLHIIAYGSPTRNLPSPTFGNISRVAGRWQTCPSVGRWDCEAERRGAAAGLAPSHRVCLLKAGRPAHRLTDSLRDSLDGSAHEMWLNTKWKQKLPLFC